MPTTRLLAAVLAVLLGAIPARAHAAPPIPSGNPLVDSVLALPGLQAQLASGAAPQQLGGWQEVALAGATCGRGAPYKYYVNPSSNPEAGIVFLLNGGGGCLKDGHAPAGSDSVATQLYCMDYNQFTDQSMNTLVVAAIGSAVPYFKRGDASNPFRDSHFVWVPYCTGDVHAGAMNAGYDYDPSPGGTFEVVHRGHLNFLAVLDDMKKRVPGDVPVVLSGLSAGGLGVIFNFPEVIKRWPHTTLIPDAGIAPPHALSLLTREGVRAASRWGARVVLPDYCTTDDCLQDTLHLLQAHASFFNGTRGHPWRPFGYLEAQQDKTLSAYLEIPKCGYELGLKVGRLQHPSDNLRAWLPATDQHVFVNTPDFKANGVTMLSWFQKVAAAKSNGDLPADAVDKWLPCSATHLPGLWLMR